MLARFPTMVGCNEKTATMEMLLRRDCALSTNVLEVVLYMLEVVNGVRRVLWVLGVMLCMCQSDALCAGSCAPCAGGREGRTAYAAGAVMCCRCGDVLQVR